MNVMNYNNPTISGNAVSTGMTGAMSAGRKMAGSSMSTGGLQYVNAAPAAGITGMSSGGGGGMFGGGGGGGGLGAVLGIVQTLGSLWSSFQQHKIAKEQLKLARESWEANLGNQTQTYNTALEDRIRTRHHFEGHANHEQMSDQYLAEHKLPDRVGDKK